MGDGGNLFSNHGLLINVIVSGRSDTSRHTFVTITFAVSNHRMFCFLCSDISSVIPYMVRRLVIVPSITNQSIFGAQL